MYFLGFISIIIVILYFLNKVNDTTVFNFDETALYLYDKKPFKIPFGTMKRIDRHWAGVEHGGIVHIRYYISFEDAAGKEQSVSFDRSFIEQQKWERCKTAILFHNPAVVINESIL